MQPIVDIKKVIRSVRFALHGLWHAYRVEKSFRMEVIYGGGVYLLVGWYLWPMTHMEVAIFVSSYLLILIVELINTAIETMLNKLHPEEHEAIRRSKDISAAAVLLSFVVAALVIGSLFCNRLEREKFRSDSFFAYYADHA